MRSIRRWNSSTRTFGSAPRDRDHRNVARDRSAGRERLERIAHALEECRTVECAVAQDVRVELLLAELDTLGIDDRDRAGVDDHQAIAVLNRNLLDREATVEHRPLVEA